MTLKEWENKRAEIEKISGNWISYEPIFDGSSFTFKAIENYQPMESVFMARVSQIVRDFWKKPLEETRILDLGCMEGLNSFEFALRGAKEVVGIEGRPPHVLRANVVKETLDLKNINFFCDDVKNLDKKKYGSFDLTLCLGIFYHLDIPDVLSLAGKIFEITESIAIIDTHFCFKPKVEVEYGGVKYDGDYAPEEWFVPRDIRMNYGFELSLENEKSFWFTKYSLLNILINAGFHSVYECVVPRGGGRQSFDDRMTIVALKNPFEEIVTLVDPGNKRVENFEKKEFNVFFMSTSHPHQADINK